MNEQSKNKSDSDALIADARRTREDREKEYRGRALKLFPHLCARCGREFAGRKMRELTVHHKDHNHDNNPPDGSNWELLCLYCHDHEHQKYLDSESSGTSALPAPDPTSGMQRPFAGLDRLLNSGKKRS